MLYQAPRQYGFSLCYYVEQTACPVLDLYEGCFHLIRMLCISVIQVVPPIEPIQATAIIVSFPEIWRNNKNNRVQSLPRIYVLWIQEHKEQGEICISGGILIYFCSICLLRLKMCGQKGVILHIWGNTGKILAPIKVNGKTPIDYGGASISPHDFSSCFILLTFLLNTSEMQIFFSSTSLCTLWTLLDPKYFICI